MLVRGPPHGWAYCVGSCPPPMVGCAVLVCGPPHGGVCCVGLWSPFWWGVLCWCVPPSWWGVLCRCVPPPPWWGVLRWLVAPLVVGRAALVRGPPPGRACRVGACPPRSWCVVWGVVICSVGCGRGCVVGLARVGVVLVCAPSPVGACRVCAWPPPWWGVLCRRVRVSVRGVVAGWMPGWLCWFAVVSAAVRPALSGVGCLWCWSGRGWCSAGACSPPCWGVPCLCVAPPLVGRAVLVRGPPFTGACCVGGRLLRWWCLVWVVVICRVGCGCGCLVGLAGVGAVLVRAPPPPVGASRVCARPPPLWGVRCLRVRVSARGVVAGWMPGWFCCLAVVSAAVRPALSGVGCLCCLPGRGWCCAGACPPPPPVGASRVCAWPPPWWGDRCLRVRVSVRGVVAGWMPGWFCCLAVVSAAVRPALSGVGCLCCLPGRGWCCAGACPPPWWGVLRWVVAPFLVGRAVLVRAPPLAGVCCVGAPLAAMVVFGLGCRRLLDGLWLWLWCWLGRVWCCAGACPPPPPRCWGVPCLCVAPPLVGPAVSACSGFGSWCCSRLDARILLLVRCCLRRRTAGVVGCCLSVVFSSPGRTGWPPERVWCAPPLSWPGRTGRPPERVRCATPCFCFAAVVALLLVVLRSLVSVRFLALRRCLSPPAAVSPPPPTPPCPSACCVPPPPRFLVPPPAVPPPPGVCPSRLVVSPSFTLVASVPCGWPFVGVSFCPPPPLPGSCFLGVGPCRSFSLVLLLLPCFFRAFGLGTCLIGFRPPPSARAGAPPPPGDLLLVVCGAPRLVLWCCGLAWAVVCGARCFAAPCCVVVRVLAVWCARQLCSWLSPVGVGHALSVGVARCSASPRCFVRCFVVCGAVVRCRVLRCFPYCSVVSWLFSLCFLGFAHLRVCAAWCCPPPPPPWFVCRAFCRFVLPRCAGLFCPLWCRVAACCVVLFGVRRAVSCCAVSCCAPRVAWCCAAIPRAAASCERIVEPEGSQCD